MSSFPPSETPPGGPGEPEVAPPSEPNSHKLYMYLRDPRLGLLEAGRKGFWRWRHPRQHNDPLRAREQIWDVGLRAVLGIGLSEEGKEIEGSADVIVREGLKKLRKSEFNYGEHDRYGLEVLQGGLIPDDNSDIKTSIRKMRDRQVVDWLSIIFVKQQFDPVEAKADLEILSNIPGHELGTFLDGDHDTKSKLLRIYIELIVNKTDTEEHQSAVDAYHKLKEEGGLINSVTGEWKSSRDVKEDHIITATPQLLDVLIELELGEIDQAEGHYAKLNNIYGGGLVGHHQARERDLWRHAHRQASPKVGLVFDYTQNSKKEPPREINEGDIAPRILDQQFRVLIQHKFEQAA